DITILRSNDWTTQDVVRKYDRISIVTRILGGPQSGVVIHQIAVSPSVLSRSNAPINVVYEVVMDNKVNTSPIQVNAPVYPVDGLRSNIMNGVVGDLRSSPIPLSTVYRAPVTKL